MRYDNGTVASDPLQDVDWSIEAVSIEVSYDTDCIHNLVRLRQAI